MFIVSEVVKLCGRGIEDAKVLEVHDDCSLYDEQRRIGMDWFYEVPGGESVDCAEIAHRI